MTDFLRYCELTIGPLADWQGKGNTGDAIRIRADGTAGRLRVQFQSVKSLSGDPNHTEIIIFNLSKELRASLRSNLTRVQVVAGYEDKPEVLVAVGALTAATSTRQGPDIVTRLSVLDGFGGMVRGAIARSYSGSTALEQVVREAASTMPGVTVDKVQVVGRLPAKGVQLSGSSAAQLNKLADQFGFSWSVQNGVFQAIMDTADTGDQFNYASGANLIACGPLLAGPTQTASGIEITAKFDARVKPGDRLRVESTVNPQLSGTYKANAVTLEFDSHGAATLKAQAIALA